MYTPAHHTNAVPIQRQSAPERTLLRVIHPLDDTLEEKRFIPANAGHMHMSRTVRWSLGVLRAYLLLITILVIVRVVQLAGAHA